MLFDTMLTIHSGHPYYCPQGNLGLGVDIYVIGESKPDLKNLK